MNETLRMFPPVPDIPKVIEKTQKLGKYTLPPNTYIRVHTTGVHYNPKYWGLDAAEFRPERWFANKVCAENAQETASYLKSEITVLKYHRDAFIPFSDGARSCLGKRFAQIELITTIAEIVRFMYPLALPRSIY